MKHNLLTGTLLVSMALSILPSCSKDKFDIPENEDVPQHKVFMTGGKFTPSDLLATPNSRVNWLNNDNITHTVTFEDGLISSGDIIPGGQYSVSFDSIGVYRYHCAHHPADTGIIRVVSR